MNKKGKSKIPGRFVRPGNDCLTFKPDCYENKVALKKLCALAGKPDIERDQIKNVNFKIMKKTFITIIGFTLAICVSFAQSYNRMENPTYALTTFLDNFNSPRLGSNIMSNQSTDRQEKFERYTIYVGLTLPVYKSSFAYAVHELALVPEVEFLFNLPFYKTIQLSMGIGIESGKHIVLEDEAKLVWRDDVKEWWPWSYRYYWNLDFFSMKVPVYLSVPLNDSFIDAFTFGAGMGWLLSYKLTEEGTPNTSFVKINRSFLDLSFGVQKKLSQFNKISLSCAPGIGYRTYLTHRNDWQNKCFLGELKFNINF